MCFTSLMVIFVACSFAATEPPRAVEPATAPATPPTTQPLTGVIKGRVTMKGGLSMAKPNLTRIAVYLGSEPALDAAQHTLDHATMEQRHKAFVPNFVIVPRGTDVEFPNWDSFDHNVFSRSKAAPAFDLDRYPRGQSKSRNFDKVGVVQVFCNIHPSMRAMIYVTPNVYFARCDADGDFTIPNVPVGHHRLNTWNERCGESSMPIDVTAGASPDIAITISQDRGDTVANDLKQPASYGIDRGLGIKRERLGLPVVKDSHPAIDPEK
jgi:plastocyanin